MTPALTLAGVFAGMLAVAVPITQFGVDAMFRLLGL
jgi:hypothetical protein